MDYKINKIKTDEFGRKSGILLLKKPQGITSHDIVDEVRRRLETKKVGHAGALDPFATGLLIILVGKATKLSDSFLGLDKSYEMKILLGIKTDSGDPEGKIIQINKEKQNITTEELKQVLNSFQPSYEQYVPVFSSVKVDGQKLRKLARKYDSFKILDKSKDKKIVQFTQNDAVVKEIELPKKEVQIGNLQIINHGEILQAEDILGIIDSYTREDVEAITAIEPLEWFRVSLDCSKGTYIRQLAVDIGERLSSSAMLVALHRTKIGKYSINDALEINSLKQFNVA